jgi:succinate dehydrogenase/fumarate reductase-like Fe-S protein
MKTMKEINVAIHRRKGPKEDAYIENYTVPLETGMSVLNVLDYVSENCDPSLAYEASCRRGLCSVCLVKVDGKVFKSCMELATGDLEIETGSKNPIKDLAFSNQRIKK